MSLACTLYLLARIVFRFASLILVIGSSIWALQDVPGTCKTAGPDKNHQTESGCNDSTRSTTKDGVNRGRDTDVGPTPHIPTPDPELVELQRKHHDAFALNEKGIDAYQAQKWDEAEAYFRRALTLTPSDRTIRGNLAKARKSKIDGIMYHLDEIDREENEGIAFAPNESALPILSRDQGLAELNRLELRGVEGRMKRLHKALDVLQKTDEEASREWEALHKEEVESLREIQWQAFLFATAGLGEVLRIATAENVQEAKALLSSRLWTEVPVERAKLERLMLSSDDASARILKEVIDAINGLERAHQAGDKVNTVLRMKEAMLVEIDTMERLGNSHSERKTVDALYELSVLMGRMALVAGKGVVEKCSAASSFVEPFAEASAIYLMGEQEEEQFRQLSGSFADRQTKRREIHEKLAELEYREQVLKWAIQRAN